MCTTKDVTSLSRSASFEFEFKDLADFFSNLLWGMASVAPPAYFELSWSILSTIGIANTLFGILVGGITSFSPVCAVPIFTSIAGAVANGLCYYAFYNDLNPILGRAVASVFADMCWMVQEAGYSFYSYIILTRILRNRSRRVFLSLFWLSMLGIAVLRVTIAILRFRIIKDQDDFRQEMVNHLHIAYFVSIALIECISAYFLLRTFATGHKMSIKALTRITPFRYLMRSTELRLTLLAFLGTTRAVTYSFQVSAQSATSVASQVDRFAYTMECMFPSVLIIDILASKLVYNTHSYGHSSQKQDTSQRQAQDRAGPRAGGPFESQKGTYGVHVQGAGNFGRATSSEECIIPNYTERNTPEAHELNDMTQKSTGITKTVEIELYPEAEGRGQAKSRTS